MPWGAPVAFNPFGEDPEEEQKRLQQQAEPGLMDVALLQAQNTPQSPVPAPADYDPFQAMAPNEIAARGADYSRAQAKKKPDMGILGEGFGVLDPKQQLEDLDARFARLDRGQKQIASLEKLLTQSKNPYQRRAIEAQLNVARSSLPDIDLLQRMEGGDAPLATKTALRTAVENAPRAFGESVLSVPEAIGIVKGYLGPGQVDDDSLVKWSLATKESLRQMLPGDEARQSDFSQQLASGLGQIATFYGAGALAALAKAGPKATAAVVAALGSTATGAGGFEEGTRELKAARDRAAATGDAASVTELDRLLKFVGYSAIGVTEAIPVARTFARAVPNPVSSLGHRLVQTGEGAIEEALQESGSQLAQNLVSQQTTDPNRATTEGVAEGGAVGGVLGGLMNALMPGKFTPPRPAAPPPQAGATTPDGVQMAPGSPGGPGMPVPVGQPYVDRGTITSVPPDAPAPAAGSGMGLSAAPELGQQAQAMPAARWMGQPAARSMGEPTVSVEPPRQLQAPRPPVIDVEAEPVPPLARARGVQRQTFTETDLNNGAIGVDAPLMQFKEGGDKEGVTDRLKGVKSWDNVRAGNTIVYEFKDGRRIIADGHQRLGLAKRLAAEGKPVDFEAFIFREADGFTPQQVRSIAAIKNIAEGSGSSLDAAKVMRELGQTPADLDLPPNSALARDAAGLSKLGDDAFGMVVNDIVPKPYAAIVGQEVADPTLQTNIMGLLARLKPSSALEARAIVSQAKQATVESTQENLFGAETSIESLYGERAKVLAEAARQLRANKRVFQTLLSNEKEAEKAGNVLNRTENERQARVSSILGDIIDRLAYATGPISTALTSAARDFKSTGKLARAGKQFADAVTDSLERGEISGIRIAGLRPESASPADQGQAEVDTETVDMFGGTTDRFNLMREQRPTASAQPPEMQESEGSFGTGDMLSALREAPQSGAGAGLGGKASDTMGGPTVAPRDIDNLGYYSKALEEAKALKQERGSGAQMLGMLRNAGVKENEIKALGLDRLAAESPTLTKAEIIKFVTERRIRLNEKAHGGPNKHQARVDEIMKLEDDLRDRILLLRLEQPGEWVTSDEKTMRRELHALQEERLELMRMHAAENPPTVYSRYSLDPLNETYQETALHLDRDALDRKLTPGELEKRRIAQLPFLARLRELDQELDEHPDHRLEIMKERNAVQDDMWNAMLKEVPDPATVKPMRAGHWPHANVIAHARTALYDDTAGRRTFLIDELQSDWGQRLRDEGIKDTGKIDALTAQVKAATAEFDRIGEENEAWVRSLSKDGSIMDSGNYGTADLHRIYSTSQPGMKDADGRSIAEESFRRINALKFAEDEARRIQAELTTAEASVTGYPLVNTTDQWVETAMRRLIAQAVEQGADRIALTPGDIQNQRFSLTTNGVQGISYSPLEGFLAIRRLPDGARRSEWDHVASNVKPEDLASYVGREVAEELLKRPLSEDPRNGFRQSHVINDLDDISIGGEGMRATYDRMYPRALGKLLQKLDKTIKPEKVKLRPSGPGAEMSEYTAEFISFPITEKAKEALAEGGQPLFALAGARAKTADKSSKQLAENMEAKGRDPRYIFRSTGWLRGPDLGWRFEIDDSAAKITNLAKVLSKPTKSLISRMFGASPVKIGSDVKAVNNVPLTDILHHPKLFQAYPFLRKMRVDLVYGKGLGSSGSLRTREAPGKTVYLPIRVKAGSEREILSVLLHEIQHYIQNHEGFAQGSDVPRDNRATKPTGIFGTGTKPPLYDPSQRGMSVRHRLDKSLLERTELEMAAENLLDLYELENSPDPETAREARSDIRATEAHLEKIMRAGPETYEKSFGEYEARLVQDRMGMTAEQRRNAYPLEDMPEDLLASRTQTRDYQQAYDEIMRRAMMNKAIKARWAERRPVGAGVAVVRPAEDRLYYFPDTAEPEAQRHGSDLARVTLYPEIAGATPRFTDGFYGLPYEQQKPIADAIIRDIRSRNMRPTIEGYLHDEAFEFWKRYDPAQVISDPRLYRAELDAAIKKAYGPEAELVLYSDINPENGLAWGDSGIVDEPWDVYAKVPGSGQRQDEIEKKLRELNRALELDQAYIRQYGPNKAVETSINEVAAKIQDLENGIVQSDFNDVISVPRAVLGDIIPAFESAYSKAADGIDKDLWMVAQREDAMRERGLSGDNKLFALSDAAGKTKLAVVHNLSAENLAFSDAIGGLAVPSMAVLKEGPRMGIGGFGEITLIGREELADPTKNPVFDADAWSMRFPKPDYSKVPRSVAQPLLTQLHKFEKLTDDYMAASNIWDYMVNDPNPADLMRAALRSAAAKSMFLATKGIAVEPVLATNDAHGAIGRPDRRATEARIDEQLKGMEVEYHNWLNDTFIAAFGRPTMKLRGRKVDYTLENIVDAMTPRKKVNAQEDFATFSEGKARAMAAKRFKSMTAMRKAAATNILSEAEVSSAREIAKTLMEEWRMAVVPFYSGKDYRGNIDTWDALDASMRAAAATAQGSMTSNGLAAALRREGFADVPQDVLDQGILGINAFMSAPVPYFESKPQRAVRLHEFAGAVIPENASEETKAILAKHRIPFRTYKDGFTKEGRELFRERETADFIKQLASDGYSTLFALKNFYSPAIRAVEEMKDTAASPERWWSLLGKAPGKKEELDLMGVKVWLDEQKGRKIPKEELVSFMRSNQVELEELIKGDTEENRDAIERKSVEIHDRMVRERMDELEKWDEGPGGVSYEVEELEDGSWGYKLNGEDSADAFDSEEEAIEAAEAAQLELQESLQAQHDEDRYQQAADSVEWYRADDKAREELRLDTGYMSTQIGMGEDYHELLIRYPKIKDEYKSKHFQDHEIVYTRFDSRFGEDGQKVLFLQEVQSDLHQHAEEKGGYRKGTLQDAYDVWNEELARNARQAYLRRSNADRRASDLEAAAKRSRVTIDGSVNYDPDAVRAAEEAAEKARQANAEFDAAYEDMDSLAQAFAAEADMDISLVKALLMAHDMPTVERYWTSHGFPDTPFKDNEWWKLALKRMIGYAASHGFDSIALPTAEQVNEAVGMPVEAARTYYEKNIPNWLRKYLKPWGVELRREKISGIEPESFWGVKPGITAEQAIAHGEKALAYAQQNIDERMKRDRERQGASAEGLAVPGHLAARKKAITYAIDELRELSDDGAHALTAEDIQAAVAHHGAESEFNYSYITTAKGDLVQSFLDERGLKHLTEDYGQGAEASLGIMRNEEREAEQTVFDITDKMREDVREKGLPLFATGQDVQNFINGRIRMGNTVQIPKAIGQSVFREIADVRAALPESDFTAVLSRIEPAKGRNAAPDAIRVIFTEQDGTEHAYDGSLDDIYSSRALYIRESQRGRGVLFLRTQPVGEGDPTIRGELRHEAVHALRKHGRLTGAAWRALVNHANHLRILDLSIREYLGTIGAPVKSGEPDRRTLREAYEANYKTFADKAEVIDQEAVAHLLELYTHIPNLFNNAPQIKALADAIFRGDFSGPAGGVSREVTDSLAALSAMTGGEGALATDSPAFKAWFGDSKVVDEDGKPLVVYHGTHKDFNKFTATDGGAADIGFHFGTIDQSNDRLSYVSRNRGPAGQNVMPVYLSIQNPLVLNDDPGSWDYYNLPFLLEKTGKFSRREIAELKAFEQEAYEVEVYTEEDGELDESNLEDLNGRWREAVVELLERKGYDGVQYRNTGEMAGMAELMERIYAADGEERSRLFAEKSAMEDAAQDRSWIALRPTQIKSAFNSGSFDPDNPDILKAFAGSNAETADLGLLNHAIEMEMEGISADDIWKQTGWTRGLEDEWRFEIDDSKAELKMPDPEWLQKAIKDDGEFELQQLFIHPKLYQAYPFLKELRVRFSNYVPFENAEFIPGNIFEEVPGKIVMGLAAGEKLVDGKRTKYPAYSGFRPEIEMMKSVLMHEIQHAIQQHENFAWGSDPGSEQREFELRLLGDRLNKQDMAVIKARGLIPQLDVILELMDMVKSGELSDEVLKETLKAQNGLAHKMGIALYGRSGGEIEARLVQARLAKPKIYRQIKRPKFDEFPREQVRAVRFGATLNGDWRSSYTQYLKSAQAAGEKPISPAEFKKELEAESV